MPTFGLIAEGPTDHVVLENILVGYFNDPDLTQSIRELQPLRDATDARLQNVSKDFEAISKT